MKIVSKSFVEGFYYKPRVDLQLLEKYHEGLIALSACLAGEVARYLTRGMYEDAKAAALRYQDIFGKGNFFLELQDHGIPEQQNVNQQLLKMHRETGIELVATNDVHYTLAEDAQPHDVLLCLQTGKKLADEDRMRYEGGQYYVKSPEEMERLFPYAPEALENTHKIAQRCQVEIEFGVTKLPKFDVPEGYTSWEYLNELCFRGLEERYQPVTEELKERLNYELSTIRNMGYVDYFLGVPVSFGNTQFQPVPKGFLELGEQRDIRTCIGINGLPIVAHGHDLCIAEFAQLQSQIKPLAGNVLILVDYDIFEPQPLPLDFLFAEHFCRTVYHVFKIYRLLFFQTLGVF